MNIGSWQLGGEAQDRPSRRCLFGIVRIQRPTPSFSRLPPPISGKGAPFPDPFAWHQSGRRPARTRFLANLSSNSRERTSTDPTFHHHQLEIYTTHFLLIFSFFCVACNIPVYLAWPASRCVHCLTVVATVKLTASSWASSVRSVPRCSYQYDCQLHLLQWAGEVIAVRDKTIVTDEFRELEHDIELRRRGLSKCVYRTT